MFQILIQYYQPLMAGFLTTLGLLGYIVVFGISFGLLLGIIGGKYSPELKSILQISRFITKVVPVLVLLFWMHYPLQGLLGIVINPFWTSVFVLSLVNVITVSHILSVEFGLLPKTYIEAGIMLGLSKNSIIRHIEIPLLMRRVLPQVLLLQATMLEYTLFAGLISAPELFRASQTLNSIIYKPVEIYSLLVIFFLLILGPLHIAVTILQKKYTIHYD
jgi:polar amino acid transport system permease protein